MPRAVQEQEQAAPFFVLPITDRSLVNEALGIIEVTGFTPAMVVLDSMDKASNVRVIQTESNDFYGVVIKIAGEVAAVRAAIDAGKAIADQMGGKPNSTVIPRVDSEAKKAIESPPESSPLLGQPVIKFPNSSSSQQREGKPVADASSFALGFIETQGFTAVFEAIDSACKAANVEVLGKEKLGGGYITVILKGDVAAVKAAVDAGTAKVNGLGKLIAGHVIARPSSAVMALLPK